MKSPNLKPMVGLRRSVCGLACALLCGLAIPVTAAISHGPAAKTKSEAEQQQQSLFEQAILSHQEKLRVGQERHERQQSEREKILAGMNSEFQSRVQNVQIRPASAAPTATVQNVAARSFRPLLAVVLVSVVVGCFAFILRQRQRERATA
jgi:uncharacterized membrane protein YraQ (UPF0718 family)